MLPFFAVHISDGLLEPGVWIPCSIIAFAIAIASTMGLSDEEIPRIGLFTAIVFVASQIHLPVYGVSVHLLLNAVAGLVLGLRCVMAISIAVLLQALLFAHGGLTTWGINSLTMTVPALTAAALYRIVPGKRIVIGTLLGLFASLFTVLLACVTVYFGGVQSSAVVAAILIAHLPVIVLEGLITGSIVAYLAKVKPEWLTAVSIPSTAPPTAQIPHSQAPSPFSNRP
jgi:cobalt/nickel transport system permease protein